MATPQPKRGLAVPKRPTPAKGKTASKCELIDTGTNTLFVRRNERGTSFKKVVDAGRSIRGRQAAKGQAQSAIGAGRSG